MEKFHFKGCPKCNGDLFLDYDLLEGWIETCIQCGFRRYLGELSDIQSATHQDELDRRDENKICEGSVVNK